MPKKAKKNRNGRCGIKKGEIIAQIDDKDYKTALLNLADFSVERRQ